MKKLGVLLLGVCACICLLLCLAACDDGGSQSSCGGHHTYGDPTVIKAATCEVMGEAQRVCLACGSTTRDDLNTINHIYENGFCTMCGRYEDEYMYFELNDDGESYRVSEYRGDANAGPEVTVPQTYRGKPVTVIGANAFSNTQHMTKINLPSTITEIEGSAFSHCTSLEAPVLPEGLKIIHNYAFMGCKFETIALPSSLTMLGNAFQQCSNLKELTIPAGITELPDEAFWLCHSLQSVTMLGEVTRVGIKAFSGLKNLTSFSAQGTPAIEDEAFSGCEALRTLDIPLGVSKIGSAAFSGCMHLYSLTLAENLTEIGNAFASEVSLSSGLPRLAQIVNYSSLDMVIEDRSLYGGILRYARGSVVNLAYGDDIPSKIEYINGFVFFVETGTRVDDGRVCRWYTLIDYIGDEYAPAFPDLRSDEYELMSYTVAAYAFYKNDVILFADMPEGVTCIEDYAFRSCERLLRLDIPSTVRTLSYEIGGGNLVEVINRTKTDLSSMKNLHDGLLYLNQELDPILYPDHSFASIIKNVDGFLMLDWHEHVSLPYQKYIIGYVGEEDVLRIPALPTDKEYDGYIIRRNAFKDLPCSGVVLPDGLTRIEEEAFWNVSVGVLTIPDSVEYIGEAAFKRSKVDKLTIPETTRVNCIFGYDSGGFDEEGLRYVDNILIDANISSDDDTVVKAGTVRLGDSAFWCERSMVKLTIAEGVKYVGRYLCYECSSLKTIVLPKSVVEIGDYLISRCNALEKIVYGGTKAEWLALIDGVMLCGGMSGRVEFTVECSDGTINMLNDSVVE